MRLQRKYHFTLCLTLPLHAHTALVNVTVDDSGPDPLTGRTISYSPVGGWQAGDHCINCKAHPDPGQVHGGTWHDSTFNSGPGLNGAPNQPPLAEFTFSGTAVYVLCVLSRTTKAPIGNSDMAFYINGTLTKTFSQLAPGTGGYDYNVTVLSTPSLPPGLHDLKIQNGHVDGSNSLMLLDAIVYTFDDGSKGSPPTPVGTILGVIIGGLAFLITAILGLLWWRKRKAEDDARQHIFQPFLFESASSTRSSSRPGQVSSLAPQMNPIGTLSLSNISGRGYADEPPAYELHELESSSRSGMGNNDPVPPRQGTKRR